MIDYFTFISHENYFIFYSNKNKVEAYVAISHIGVHNLIIYLEIK